MGAEPEAPENTALAGLLATISDRRIRRKVQKLLQLGEEAVRALGELDAALYLREDGELQLRIVADEVGCEVIEQAFVKAERLSGLNDEIDGLVRQWSSLTAEDRADVESAVALDRQLLVDDTVEAIHMTIDVNVRDQIGETPNGHTAASCL